MRLRNGFALLVALFVFVAASQAAVCEMACSTHVLQSCCQSAGAADAMDMSGGADCHGVKSSTPNAGVFAGCGSNCHQVVVLAPGGDASVSAHFAKVQWVVVAVLPIQTTLSGRDRIASKNPPRRWAATDPLLMGLRV
jgi:hypothetical protein